MGIMVHEKFTSIVNDTYAKFLSLEPVDISQRWFESRQCLIPGLTGPPIPVPTHLCQVLRASPTMCALSFSLVFSFFFFFRLLLLCASKPPCEICRLPFSHTDMAGWGLNHVC